MPIRAILTDIEGTTSSIHFVHQVLFPYSAKAIPAFVQTHPQRPELTPWLSMVAAELGNSEPSAIVEALLGWIAEDRKHPALKAIQGMVWADGYASGDFKAHIYPEVPARLVQWHQHQLIYVYSSGSIAAQKLLFGHTEAGNLLAHFDGFFDTSSGNKRECDSYLNIARAIGLVPSEILFLSDIEAELDAAKAAGMATTLLARDGKPAHSAHRMATSFDEIHP
jgi:enolase-phosphatase E1